MLDQPTLGQILCVPYTFNMSGWLPCEGQVLNIRDGSSNAMLFSLLGGRFGGDGKTTFGLPDLRGKEPAPGLKWIIAITGQYPAKEE